MILITQDSAQAFTLTTKAGRTVEVFISDAFTTVYAGRDRFGMGRTFHWGTAQERLTQAINAYKCRQVKAALQALLDELN